MDELITECTLICKLHGSFMRLAYLFDMLAMGVCATRYCQAPGRLVLESNVCTVGVSYPASMEYTFDYLLVLANFIRCVAHSKCKMAILCIFFKLVSIYFLFHSY